ncbi:hypothetical protein SD78_3264 [Bacillus badius]|nr:hypothetical protein SD78_3264 [Bacillus badius]
MSALRGGRGADRVPKKPCLHRKKEKLRKSKQKSYKRALKTQKTKHKHRGTSCALDHNWLFHHQFFYGLIHYPGKAWFYFLIYCRFVELSFFEFDGCPGKA